ncbi:MAG: SpoIID/LytB domain-containing protein [Candidatus Moraniibacteriota bacterium]|jgi:peptidoglycan hydrolase-like amidase
MLHKKNITIANSTIFLTILCLLFFGMTKFSFAAEWRYEGVAYYVPTSSSNNLPIYRFYSPKNKSHFFTKSKSEKDAIIKKYPTTEWRYEGVAYYVPKSSTGNQAVYRFYSPSKKTHFFTKSKSEKDAIIKKYPTTEWRYEGVAYYVPITSTNNKPVYRFYNTINKAHFFTASESEKIRLTASIYGPYISIGLHEYSRSTLKDSAFKIDSKKDYLIKDKNGTTIAKIKAGVQTKVKYDSDGNLKIYNSISEKKVNKEVRFEAADGNNSGMIFDIHKPESDFDEYRGKTKLRYSDTSKNIWVINELPLEYYIWGMGEITGTGPMEYNKMMTTAYRTYGYWKILYSTKYATEGFKVNATPGNQIYYGYEWEKRYPRIREGAESTRGKIAKHGDDVALTPYSSWTDGKTRSFEEHWGSTLYPWCQSVSDPYGDYNGDYWDNSYKSTSDLVASGNHMVGISAHGALTLANDKNWNWDRIMKYYLDGINIVSIY